MRTRCFEPNTEEVGGGGGEKKRLASRDCASISSPLGELVLCDLTQ